MSATSGAPESSTRAAPSRRLAGIQRSGIREIMELAREIPSALHLEVGEPDFDTPAHVIEGAADAARAGMTRYTPSRGLPEVREAAAAKLRRVNDIDADPGSGILVTAGAANALLVALAAVVDEEDTVLIPDPGWPNYNSMSRMLGLRVRPYPLRADDGFQPDVDALARLAATGDVGAIVLNSPSNPTGAIISPERLERIVAIAADAGATLVSDECYDEIVLTEDVRPVSPATLDPTADVVSVFSLSKTYAMTGWRIGYAAGPAHLVDPMARIQEAWLSCCSAPVQKAAETALLGDQSAVEAMVNAYRHRRDAAVRTAEELALPVHPPEGAFYLMVDLSPHAEDGRAFARDLLTSGKVAVAPGETFGSESAGMVRVSLAARQDDIVEGLRRLASHLVAGSPDEQPGADAGSPEDG